MTPSQTDFRVRNQADFFVSIGLREWGADLEVDRCQRYDSQGRTGGYHFRAQGAREHEAKEHDLPLVRQERA
jgi:hypothetical protein